MECGGPYDEMCEAMCSLLVMRLLMLGAFKGGGAAFIREKCYARLACVLKGRVWESNMVIETYYMLVCYMQGESTVNNKASIDMLLLLMMTKGKTP